MKILNGHSIQDNFLGFNAVYQGYAGLSDSDGRVYNEELCELEADRAADCGIKVARTYYKWYAWDEKNNCWDWENSYDFNQFCKWAHRLQVRGIDIALNAGWCCPGDILSNSWGGKSPFTVEGNWEKSVENFAAWVSESVHQLIEVRGLTNVKYLVMFTEPQRQPHQCWYEATRAVADRLIADGRRHLVKMIGPNEGATADPQMMKWAYEKDPTLVDIWSAHNYMYTFENNPKYALGEKRCSFTGTGKRLHQFVDLKPHTTYTFSFDLKLENVDFKTVCGYILCGCFKDRGRQPILISVTDGVERVERLTGDSTTMIDPSKLKEGWQRFSFTFTTEEDVEKAYVGLYMAIKPGVYELHLDNFSLKASGEEQEVLKATKLLGNPYWHYNNIPYDIIRINGPQYFSWLGWVKDYLTYLPKGTDFWFDEYNTAGFRTGCEGLVHYDHPLHGTNLSIAKIAFLNSGIQSSLQWTLFDQQWPNNHTTGVTGFFDGVQKFGVMPNLLESRVPYPAYYAQRITGLAGGAPGTKIYAGGYEDGICAAMVEQPDGKKVLLVVNDNPTEKPLNVTFEKPLELTFNRFLYDPATVKPTAEIEPLVPNNTVAVSENNLQDTLPAGAVVAYVEI